MKRVFVLGCFYTNGVCGNDSDILRSYTELGWELLTTGFWAKLNLSKNDFICTTKDRLFMYEHITENLIEWEKLSDYKFDEIYNVFDNIEQLAETHDNTNFTEDIKLKVTENNIKEDDGLDSYICVQIRRRDHAAYRNGPTELWIKLINSLSKNVKKVYVVGKGNDDCIFPENVEIVSLQKYCSLIKSKNCLASIGSSSGCMYLNYFYGRKGLPTYILYTEGAPNEKLFWFPKKTNFANVDSKLFVNFNDLSNTLFQEIINL